MQFGVFVFPTDYSMNVVDLGRAVEDHGFESFWVTEHTHIPTSRLSPWPGGSELPKHYSHTLDPFVGLAAVAAATTTLKIGTGVCLVIEHDPITLAKQVASIDFLSGGRFLFGIGGGWNREEMENHGTDPKTRWRLLREQIQAMKAIWTNDEAEYHGDFVRFDPIWSWPKPVQKPHPPILMGGNGPTTLQRIVEYCDEWFPIVGRGHPLEERIPELRRLAAEAGRGTIPVSIFNAPNDSKEIERFEKIGVTRCVFGLPSAGSDEVVPLIGRLAETAKSFR